MIFPRVSGGYANLLMVKAQGVLEFNNSIFMQKCFSCLLCWGINFKNSYINELPYENAGIKSGTMRMAILYSSQQSQQSQQLQVLQQLQ